MARMIRTILAFASMAGVLRSPDVQGGYQETIDQAVEGMIANTEPKNIISRELETAAGVGFGRVVTRGGTDPDHGAQVPLVAAEEALGITVRDVTLPQSSNDQYQQYDTIAILDRGVIWCTATGEAVAAGDGVVFNDTTGELRTTAGAGWTALPGAIWESSAASGALAKVRLG